jgi:hypothetical protein
VTGEIAPDDHLYPKGDAFAAYRYVGGGGVDQPVRADISCCFQHIGGDLVQHLAFIGDGARQDHVEGRNAIGCDHDQPFIGYRIDIANLSAIEFRLQGELQLLHIERLTGAICPLARKIKFSGQHYNVYFSKRPDFVRFH